ncbi:diadenosine tetraphosphate hydrolase [Candidatus Peregrinibacteria bacterium CG10_big_fil_rev_8_21_14_0_10_36_19]|nr:MAG: diadenosine tetraphosphate hydrolase [Candidatus Peregrinibacteria bacterium CG10_big_fil_rev_8_21_14_0_10_36_19]
MELNYDEKSCGVVTFRELEGERLYLILKYPGGHFDLVKGHVENGETEHETATRELIEETGIADIQYVDGFRYEVFYTYMRQGQKSDKLVVFFLGKTEMEDVRISHEHHDFYWLNFEAALEKLTFDNAKNLLKAAENFLA